MNKNKQIFETVNRNELIKKINISFYEDDIKLLSDSLDYLNKLVINKDINNIVKITNILFVLYPRNQRIIELITPYLSEFYDLNLKEELVKNYNSAIKYMLEITSKMKVTSMIDLGAGVGSWLKAGNHLNVSKLTGVEKYYENTLDFDVQILEQDICKPIYEKFDLAISIEVAEHLNPKMSKIFIDNITSCSDVVLFGAGSIFQSGDAHMNCRNNSYWVELFKNRGYECIDFFRAKFWNDESISKDYVQNTFLYIKENSKYGNTFKSEILFDIDHPSLINAHYLNKFRKNKILFNEL